MPPSPTAAPAVRSDVPGHADPHGRRAARVLAVCQALYTSSVSIDLTLTGLVGYTLAADKSSIPCFGAVVGGRGSVPSQPRIDLLGP